MFGEHVNTLQDTQLGEHITMASSASGSWEWGGILPSDKRAEPFCGGGGWRGSHTWLTPKASGRRQGMEKPKFKQSNYCLRQRPRRIDNSDSVV